MRVERALRIAAGAAACVVGLGSVTLSAEPAAQGESARASGGPAPAARSPSELVADVQATLRRLPRGAAPAPADVERLVGLHDALVADKALEPARRRQLRVAVRSKLLELARVLARDGVAVRPAADARYAPPPVLAQVGGAGGAAPAGAAGAAREADRLIELIERTIAPASWETNGGQGVIVYWRLGGALVVRQTGAAHEALDDLLGQMRRD